MCVIMVNSNTKNPAHNFLMVTVKFRLHYIISFCEHRNFISNFIRLLHIRSLKSHRCVTIVNQHAISSCSTASLKRPWGSRRCDWTFPRPAQGAAMSGGGVSGGLLTERGEGTHGAGVSTALATCLPTATLTHTGPWDTTAPGWE